MSSELVIGVWYAWFAVCLTLQTFAVCFLSDLLMTGDLVTKPFRVSCSGRVYYDRNGWQSDKPIMKNDWLNKYIIKEISPTGNRKFGFIGILYWLAKNKIKHIAGLLPSQAFFYNKECQRKLS